MQFVLLLFLCKQFNENQRHFSDVFYQKNSFLTSDKHLIMYPQQYPDLPPPSYSNQVGFNSIPQSLDDRMRKFQHLVDRYEINRDFATRLRGLEGYEIAHLLSMVKRKYFPNTFFKKMCSF